MIDDEKRKTFYALNDMRQFKFRLAIEGVAVGVFVGGPWAAWRLELPQASVVRPRLVQRHVPPRPGRCHRTVAPR